MTPVCNFLSPRHAFYRNNKKKKSVITAQKQQRGRLSFQEEAFPGRRRTRELNLRRAFLLKDRAKATNLYVL